MTPNHMAKAQPFRHDSKRYVWCKNKTASNHIKQNKKHTVQHGGGSIILWSHSLYHGNLFRHKTLHSTAIEL